MTGFVFGVDNPRGSDLGHVTNGSIQRLMRIAKANGWDEVTYDAREELQRRACRRPDPDA